MRIRQIVFACADLAASQALLARLFGLDAPFRDPGVGDFGLDNAVFVLGDQFVEIVSPVKDGTAGGRLIERRGDSGYMLILQTQDLAKDRARFAALGVRSVWSCDHGDIAANHLHPKDIGGAIVSVDQPVPPGAWKWGGPDWKRQDGARGQQRVTSVTVEAHDPEAMARRWAEVLGLSPPHLRAGAFHLALRDGFVAFQRAGARGEGISGYTLAVADKAAVLAAAAAEGLLADDDGFTLFGCRIGLG